MLGSLRQLAGGPAAGRLIDGLSRSLDLSLARPRLRNDSEIVGFSTRWGERYAIAHSPQSGAYLRLTGDEADLARRLDGTRSVGELAIKQLGEDGKLDPAEVADLIAVLRDHEFFDQPPMDTYAALRRRLLPRRSRAAEQAWGWLRKQTIPVPGADAFVGAVYRTGGRVCFSLAANVLAVAALLAGLAAFVALARRGAYPLTGHVSTGTAASLLGLSLVVLFVHEMGHALAVRHAGRRIVRAGFRLYLGHPAFFIDSSDLLLAPRRARVINALAGPYAEAVVGGVVSLAAWLAPTAPAASVLFRLAGLTYLGVLINLIPFVELDGYWLLSDVLNVPRLRQRAFAVLRYELPGRLRRRRSSLSGAERMLVMFGIGGAVFPVAALVTAWTFWGPIAQRLFTAMWNGGLLGRMVFVLLLGLIAGPLAHVAGPAVRTAVRWVRRAADDLRFWAQTSWRVEAAEAVAALPTLVAEIDSADLAGRVSRRRVPEGAVVIWQDEAADAFYLVRRGRFAVVERDEGAGERLLCRVGPGDSFGELALLEHRPQTATVRADTDGELFVIDAGTFQRVLAPVMTTPEPAPAKRPALEVQALPPFRHLGLADAALLAERGKWILHGPGEIVVFQGDETDGFYILTAGQAEVVHDGARTTVLRAGDHFGEIALLHDVPRPATVRTITPARLFRLDGDAFPLASRALRRETLRSADASH